VRTRTEAERTIAGVRRPLLASVLVLVLAAALGACGSSGGTAASSTTTTWEPAGPNPSTSAKMICENEAQVDIAASLGVKASSVTTPTWVGHVYSCTYVYPNARITLSVKEMSTTAETTAYFDAQAKVLGQRPGRVAIGQGAFQTTVGDIVVRKDWKVLTVDISKVPASFGQPPETASSLAVSIAATILGCWTGA
jgi:hypothetical protein